MRRLKPLMRIAMIQLGGLMIAELVPLPSWAHPGHGAEGGDWSLLHYLIEPDHLLAALVLAVLVAWPIAHLVIRGLRARRRH